MLALTFFDLRKGRFRQERGSIICSSSSPTIDLASLIMRLFLNLDSLISGKSGGWT
jgi:hypothetical protein